METKSSLAALTLLWCMAVLGSAGLSHQFPMPSNIPTKIEVPSGNKFHLALYGVGFQHYTYNGSSWALQNVTARLYRRPEGKQIGKLIVLPKADPKAGQRRWETFHPKSEVTAKIIEFVIVDPKSVPWGLLQATSKSGNKKFLGAVTYVQRTETKSGLPPSSGNAKVGNTHASPFSATYVYYVKAH